MKPLYLSLEGINSFTDKQEIFFDRLDDRLFCICGATGSGKTTILDSIILALYGKGGRGRIGDYINLSMTSGAVDFEFEYEGNVYRVERRFFKDANKPSKCLLIDKTSSKILADTASAADAKLKEIIGLAREEFTQIALLEQGKFSEFLSADKAARNATVGNLFRLDKYKNLFQKFNGRKAILDERLKGLTKQFSECSEASEQTIENLVKKHLELKDSQAKAEQKLKDCVSALEKQQALKLEYDSILKAKEQQKSAEEKLAAIGEEIAALEKKLGDINLHKDTAAAKKVSIEKDKLLFGELEGLKNTYSLRKSYAEKVKTLENSLKECGQNIDKNNQDFATAKQHVESLSQEIKKDISEISAIYKLDKDLLGSGQELGNGQELRLRLLELSQKTATLIADRARLKNELEQNQSKLAKATGSLASNENILAEAIKESNRLKNETDENRAQIEQLKDSLKAAQMADAATHIRDALKCGDLCPVCGGTFSQHGQKSGQSKASELEIQLKAKEKEQEERYEKLQKAENAKVMTAASIDTLRKEIEATNSTIKELKASQLSICANVLCEDRLGELPDLLSTLTKSAAAIEGEDKKLATLKEGAGKLSEAKQRLVTELSQKSDEIRDMERIITAKTGGEDLYIVQEAVQKRVAADSDFVTRFENSKTETQNKIIEKSKEYSEVTGEIKSISGVSKKDIQFDADAFAALGETKAKLESERGQFERDIVGAERDIAAAKTELARKKTLETEIKLNTDKLDRLSLILKIIKGDRFLEYVAEEYIQRFTARASNILAKISSGKYTMEYESGIFYVRDFLMGGELRKATTLSGGETFLASLALAMAISEEISSYKSFEFFFLDEGFGTLDSNSIDIVYEALETLSKETLVGIVSHRSELVDKIQSKVSVIAATDTSGSKIVM